MAFRGVHTFNFSYDNRNLLKWSLVTRPTPRWHVVVCQISTGCFFVRQTALEEILACRQTDSGHWLCLVQGCFRSGNEVLSVSDVTFRSRASHRENRCFGAYINKIPGHGVWSSSLFVYRSCMDLDETKKTEQQNPEGRYWCMLYNKHNSWKCLKHRYIVLQTRHRVWLKDDDSVRLEVVFFLWCQNKKQFSQKRKEKCLVRLNANGTSKHAEWYSRENHVMVFPFSPTHAV